MSTFSVTFAFADDAGNTQPATIKVRAASKTNALVNALRRAKDQCATYNVRFVGIVRCSLAVA